MAKTTKLYFVSGSRSLTVTVVLAVFLRPEIGRVAVSSSTFASTALFPLLYTTFVYEITLSSGYDIRNLLEITGIQVNIKDCKNLAEYGLIRVIWYLDLLHSIVLFVVYISGTGCVILLNF